MLEEAKPELTLRWIRVVKQSSAGSEYASLHAIWFLAGDACRRKGASSDAMG
jgi:hypothetical protein